MEKNGQEKECQSHEWLGKCNGKLQWDSRIQLRMAKIKRLNNASAGKGVEQQTCSLSASGSLNWSNLFGKLALSVTMEHLNILWPISSTPAYFTNWNACPCAPRDKCKDVHSSVTYSRQHWKQLKWSSRVELINELWYISKMTPQEWKSMGYSWTEKQEWTTLLHNRSQPQIR